MRLDAVPVGCEELDRGDVHRLHIDLAEIPSPARFAIDHLVSNGVPLAWISRRIASPDAGEVRRGGLGGWPGGP